MAGVRIDGETGGVSLADNSGAVRAALEAAVARALEEVGGQWETYAKGLAPPKWGAELRNSIDHQADGREVLVGSNLEIAAYAELGTGRHYEPPPQWLENNVPKGTHVDAAGLDHWIYFDPLENRFKIGAPQTASPYLRPAFEEHLQEYETIIREALEDAAG